MDLIKVNPAPKFDRSKPHGTIYGSGAGDLAAAYCTSEGHYFAGDGRYVGSDKRSRGTGVSNAKPEPTVNQGAKIVTEAELPKLLEHPRADELMRMPLDSLANLVSVAGGPSFSGDQAHSLYTGWLLKYTNVDQ